MQPFKLASGDTLLTQTSKLSPVGQIDTSSVQQASNVPMLQGARNELVSPQKPIPDIVTPSLPKAIAGTLNTVTQVAFDYDEKLAQLDADEAVLGFRSKIHELFEGTPSTTGLEGGYANLRNREAMDGLSGYRKSIDELTTNTLASLPEYARSKALLRVNSLREDYTTQGIRHYRNEAENHEKNILAQEESALLQEIERDGAKPFTNGRIAEHLAKYPEVDKREAVFDRLTKHAIFNRYNKAHELASQDPTDLTPAVTAYKDTVKLYSDIKGTLPVATNNMAYNTISGMEDTAKQQAKAAFTEREKKSKRLITREAPNRLGAAIFNEDYESLRDTFNTLKSVASTDPDESSDKAVKMLKEALYTVTLDKGGQTYDDMKIFIQNQMGKIIEAGDFDTIELGKLQHIANKELPDAIRSEMDRADQDVLNQHALALYMNATPGVGNAPTATQKGSKYEVFADPPVNMLSENQTKYYKMFDDYEKWAENKSKGVISGYTPEKAAGLYLVYSDMVMSGNRLTNAQQVQLRSWLTEKSITTKQFEDIIVRNQEIELVGNSTPTFAKKPEYKAVIAAVEQADTLFAQRPKPKVKKSSQPTMEEAKALHEWTISAKIEQAKFKSELMRANQEALKAKKPFSPNQFLKDWVKERLNKGQVASPFDGFGDYLKEKYVPDFKGIFTGETRSVMDDLEEE